MTCQCPPTRCLGRVGTEESWACRALLDSGVLSAREPAAATALIDRLSGWSARAITPCPKCHNRCWTIGAAGTPWRKCAGPAGCGHEFNPEAPAASPGAETLAARNDGRRAA